MPVGPKRASKCLDETTVQTIVSARVWAIPCRQIPPRHSGAQHVKYRIHDFAIVNARGFPALRQQRFEQCPILIAQIKSQDPPPSTEYYVRPSYSMNCLGTDSGIMSVNDLLFNCGHIHWSLDRCLLAVLPLVFSAPTLDG